MADIDVERKPGKGAQAVGGTGNSTSWILAIVAVLAVVGLMAWLAMESNRTTTAQVVEEGTAAGAGATAGGAAAGGGAEPAELGMVAGAPDDYVGRRVRIDDVEVAADLGPSAFWGDVPGANPFLVLLSPNVTNAPQIAPGQSLDVQGVINVVTDSLVNVWVESGAIRAGARDEASFATHYLLAEQISR